MLLLQKSVVAQEKDQIKTRSILAMSVHLEMGSYTYGASLGENLNDLGMGGFGMGVRLYNWQLALTALNRNVEPTAKLLDQSGYWDPEQVPLQIGGYEITLGYRIPVINRISISPHIGVGQQTLSKKEDYHINWDLQSDSELLLLLGVFSELIIGKQAYYDSEKNSQISLYGKVQTHFVDYSDIEIGKGRVWDVLIGLRLEWGLLNRREGRRK